MMTISAGAIPCTLHSSLNSKITQLAFFRHLTGTSIVIDDFGAYSDAICVCGVTNIGGSSFTIHRAGSGTTKTHLAGNQNATDAITLTADGAKLTLSCSNYMQVTLIMGTLA